MNKLATKFGAGLVAASLFAMSAMPALAAKNVIKGNGRLSTNTINVTSTKTTTITQTNVAVFTNTVSTSSNTGGNSSNDNIGGSPTVESGGITTTVTILNVANANVIN